MYAISSRLGMEDVEEYGVLASRYKGRWFSRNSGRASIVAVRDCNSGFIERSQQKTKSTYRYSEVR